MMNGGDFDDAMNVVDVWLHDNPARSIWERDEYSVPQNDDDKELDFDPSSRHYTLTGVYDS